MSIRNLLITTDNHANAKRTLLVPADCDTSTNMNASPKRLALIAPPSSRTKGDCDTEDQASSAIQASSFTVSKPASEMTGPSSTRRKRLGNHRDEGSLQERQPPGKRRMRVTF